jgi:hypothetical protein
MVHPSQRSNATSTSSCGFDEDSSMEPQAQARKKKVEWSSDLNSMEQPEPDQRSPMWDSETGTFRFGKKENPLSLLTHMVRARSLAVVFLGRFDWS